MFQSSRGCQIRPGPHNQRLVAEPATLVLWRAHGLFKSRWFILGMCYRLRCADVRDALLLKLIVLSRKATR